MSDRKSGFIAIAGRPNSGKSTLLNALLKTKISIVTPKAQTTRERVHGILTVKEGQIVFIDTPGIHRAKEGGINEYMMSEVHAALDAPDLIWYIVDPASALKHESVVVDIIAKTKSPFILILNKNDLKRSINEIPRIEADLMKEFELRGMTPTAVLKISAYKKRGLTELMQVTWKQLKPGPFHFEDEDQLSDRPTRYFVSEKIREQLFLKLGEELPYSCAIQIEKFQENAKPPRIEAVIHVERDSQKGMVIGASGKKIKEIGTAAREEIEEFLGGKVFLGLNVKVLKDWSKNPDHLKQLGYDLPKGKQKRA